jgi:hypothetical protein
MVKFLTTLYCCTPRRIGSIASRGTECRKLTNALSPATVYEMRSAHNSGFVGNPYLTGLWKGSPSAT